MVLWCHWCLPAIAGGKMLVLRHWLPRKAAVSSPDTGTRGHDKHRGEGKWRGRCVGSSPRKTSSCSSFTFFSYVPLCQSLMPQHRPPFLNAHYDKMRSAGKSPLLINMFPAYLEIFWSQRQFVFWETASLYRLSNNSFVQHLPVV